VGTLEAIKVKILIMGEEQNPLTLRIELTSENDLFFHFNHNLDEHGFRQVCWMRPDQRGARMRPDKNGAWQQAPKAVACSGPITSDGTRS
jgi:hypothetical protein